MLQIVRRNLGLKALALALAIVGWAYFRFAENPILTARFDQQITVPIAAVNLPAGSIARFNDRQAVITIAPRRGEPPIRTQEIKAIVDLSNHTPGVYNVPVQLVAPNVAVQSLSPASVTLTIEKIDQRTFPLAIHYAAQSNVVVRSLTLTPSTAVVRGPTDELSQVTTVRVDIPLQNGPAKLDEMIRPAAVTAAGQEIPDLQVVPNLVRVQAQFAPSTVGT